MAENPLDQYPRILDSSGIKLEFPKSAKRIGPFDWVYQITDKHLLIAAHQVDGYIHWSKIKLDDLRNKDFTLWDLLDLFKKQDV